jgi:hypothetical protein
LPLLDFGGLDLPHYFVLYIVFVWMVTLSLHYALRELTIVGLCRTKFTQTAKITSFASSVAGPVEEFIVKKFKQNAQKVPIAMSSPSQTQMLTSLSLFSLTFQGRDIMEAAIDLVQKEALSFDFV